MNDQFILAMIYVLNLQRFTQVILRNFRLEHHMDDQDMFMMIIFVML